MQISKGILRLLWVSGLCGLVTSCAYIIPENPNAPRNNTVLGERRKPQLNVPVLGPQTAITPRDTGSVGAPTPQVAVMDLPPVDAQTQAQAQQMMAAPVVEARHAPTENPSFEVAASSFPDLHSVPPRPVVSGEGSAAARLSATKVMLEKDRTTAMDSKNTLARDAAAEPSMLSELPPTDPNLPVPMAPALTPNSVTIPSLDRVREAPDATLMKPQALAPVAAQPMQVASISVAPARVALPPLSPSPVLPANPNFAPPAPLNADMAATAWRAPATQPIALRAPVVTAPALIPPVSVADGATPRVVTGDFDPLAVPDMGMPVAPAASHAGAIVGDFDPLTVADNTAVAPVVAANARALSLSATAGSRYIAPSRYATVRR